MSARNASAVPGPALLVLERVAATRRRRARRALACRLAGKVLPVAGILGYLTWSLQQVAPR